jgi:hypothetical protein
LAFSFSVTSGSISCHDESSTLSQVREADRQPSVQEGDCRKPEDVSVRPGKA